MALSDRAGAWLAGRSDVDANARRIGTQRFRLAPERGRAACADWRAGRHLDVGFTCASLATPYARRLSGATLYVDGGVNIMA